MVEEHFYRLLPLALIALPSLRSRHWASILCILITWFGLKPWIPFHGPGDWLWMFELDAAHRRMDALAAAPHDSSLRVLRVECGSGIRTRGTELAQSGVGRDRNLLLRNLPRAFVQFPTND